MSKRKEVTAIQILDVSVTNDDNDELVGIVQISNRTLDKKPIWMLIDNYLIGNKSRTFIHKQMLFSFLNKHFAYTTNIFYPIFVQSDVKVTIGSGKEKKIKTYPGIIIGTDANSFKGYRVALFETDTGQENVCDLHDCSAKDIVQFEVANILAPCLADFQPEVRFEDRLPEKDAAIMALLLGPKKPLTKRQKTFLNDPTIPQSISHVKTFPDSKAWMESLNTEVHGLYNIKKSFDLITEEELRTKYNDLPILPSSVVFKRKLDQDGNIKRYKCRLVVGGHKQKEGDGTYDATFAPTASLTTQRMCLTLAVNYNLKPYQLDVEQAFLNSDLDTLIIMKLPPGLIIEGKSYAKLNKAIYGLKQSPNLWYNLCYETIIQCESLLQRSKTDPCLFFHVSKNLIIFLTVTVDDIAIFTNNESWFKIFKEKFNEKYN